MKHIIDTDELEKLAYKFTAYNSFGGNAEDMHVVDIADLLALLASSPQADDVRKDAERLDFIEAKFTGLSDSERYLPFRLYWGKGNNKTLRQVIDQAIDKARE